VPVVGATGLGNIERLAIGGAVDATPGSGGDGRLTLSALLGFQPQVGTTRLQLLAEAGGHRFSNVGGSQLGRSTGPDAWLPFAGVRLGAARTVPEHGFVELGCWLFGRYDLGHKTVTTVTTFMGEGPGADYRVGGFMVGLAFEVGLRLESPHPWNQGVELL
jgi:hypothetical protein